MFVENAADIDGDDYFFLEEAIYDRLHEEDRGLFYDCEAADLRGMHSTHRASFLPSFFSLSSIPYSRPE